MFKKKIVIIICVITAILMFLDNRLTHLVRDYSQAYLTGFVNEQINHVVYNEFLNSGQRHFTEIVNDSDGKPMYLKVDTVSINILSGKIINGMQERLVNINGKGEIGVPLGSVFGNEMLAGWGPKINIKIVPIGHVRGGYKTVFEQSGINQTRHKIYLSIATDIEMIIRWRRTRVTVERNVLVSDTVLVGTAPNTYVNVQDEEQMMNFVPLQ